MIRQGKDTDKEALMQLWKCCFPQDSDSFIVFYFNNVYRNEEMLVYMENEQLIASLQIIPYQIKKGYAILHGGYISGAMTHPDYRMKGYMSKLLLTSFDVMIEKGYDYAFLIPQEKGLIDMYAKYGFHLCEPNKQYIENYVLKNPKQWSIIQQVFYEENGIWLEEEPISPNEHKGMIKRLNPGAEEIKTLYLGMMLD